MSKLQANECEYCGRLFLTKYSTQKYCGKACKVESRKNKKENLDHLCWRCANSCGRCTWSKKLLPVEGWTAAPSVIKCGEITLHSFCVKACPKFIFE